MNVWSPKPKYTLLMRTGITWFLNTTCQKDRNKPIECDSKVPHFKQYKQKRSSTEINQVQCRNEWTEVGRKRQMRRKFLGEENKVYWIMLQVQSHLHWLLWAVLPKSLLSYASLKMYINVGTIQCSHTKIINSCKPQSNSSTPQLDGNRKLHAM